MKAFKIINTEIRDQTCLSEKNDELMMSMIDIVVTIEVNKKQYSLLYQMSETCDVNAVSLHLTAVDEQYDYEELFELFEEEDEFYFFLDEVNEEAKLHDKFKEYLEREYIVDDNYKSGIDADSVNNRIIRH